MPVAPDGRIDAASADAWLARNVDPERVEAERRGRETAQNGQLAATADIRRLKLTADVKLAQIEIGKRTGALIGRDVVEKFVFERGRAERDAWVSWIARTAPALAQELDVDPQKAFAFLDRAVREHLIELSEAKVESP
jgi:hypothetical protein